MINETLIYVIFNLFMNTRNIVLELDFFAENEEELIAKLLKI